MPRPCQHNPSLTEIAAQSPSVAGTGRWCGGSPSRPARVPAFGGRLAIGVAAASAAFGPCDRVSAQSVQNVESASSATVASVTTMVIGRVVDDQGLPVAGANVTSDLGGQACTDDLGAFALQVPSPNDARGVLITATAMLRGQTAIGSQRLIGLVPGASVRPSDLQLSLTQPCEPAWVPSVGGEPGVDGVVTSLVVFDDGSGPALYVGGFFSSANGQKINNIARWDGRSWQPLGSGVNDTASTMRVYDAQDGQGPKLYVGGQFSSAGGIFVNRIASWNGTAWSALGRGVGTGYYEWISDLAVYDAGQGAGPELCVGGRFSVAGVLPVKNIAKWNGKTRRWSALGEGVDNDVYALDVYTQGGGSGPLLIAGGSFKNAGGLSAQYIASWDGQAWAPLGSGMNERVYALEVLGAGPGSVPGLIAGGGFTMAGGQPVQRIAQWDGQTWSALGNQPANGVSSLAVYDDHSGSGPKLYVGGEFPTGPYPAAGYLRAWDGSAWFTVGPELDSSPAEMVGYDDGSGAGSALFLGGGFEMAGELPVDGLAKWNGVQWSALGRGVTHWVRTVVVHDDGSGAGPRLYAGGQFLGAGGQLVNRIACWTGAAWSPLGAGLDSIVTCLVSAPGGGGVGPALYAGGYFKFSGSVSAQRIAKWDGQAWSALSSGLNGEPADLAIFDDGSGAGQALYATGNFNYAGGVPASYIAKWDGQAWSSLGAGLNDGGISLAVWDDGSGAGPALYVCGSFSAAGGVAANKFARWDGQNWQALGSGIPPSSSYGYELAVFDDGGAAGPALYATGNFTSIGGVAASRIAKWDGTGWSPLGAGINHIGYALMVHDDGSGPGLYVGGSFLSAGGLPANYVAKWDGQAWSAPLSAFSAPVYDLASFTDASGSGPALYAAGNFNTSLAGDSFIAKLGCASPAAGYALTAAGPGADFQSRLTAAPMWNGAHIVPSFSLEPADSFRRGFLLIGDPTIPLDPGIPWPWEPYAGPGLSGAWLTLPLLGDQSLELPAPLRQALFGREIQVQSIFTEAPGESVGFSNPLRMRIER
jgi:trimeric autotransporter adhesin